MDGRTMTGRMDRRSDEWTADMKRFCMDEEREVGGGGPMTSGNGGFCS